MVLTHYVCQMAYEGDMDAVKAWLAADPARDVTDVFESRDDFSNQLNLLSLSAGGNPNEGKIALTRWLLAQGVDPCHHVAPAVTPLYLAASTAGQEGSLELVSMFLEAAPLARQIASGMTPIRAAIVHGFGGNTNDDDYSPSDTMEMIKLLLRHGAPLDDYAGYAGGGGTRLTAGPPNGGRFSADTCLSTGETNFPQLAQNEAFVEAKAVVAGVRACGGSWTSYCRLPHKELLRLRSLILRGRARPRREPITARRVAAHRSITFLLCKLGDNGVVWKILEFWQATR